MSLALAIQHVYVNQRTKELIINATASGNYANSGTTGDTVNLLNATNPNFDTSAAVGYPGTIHDWEVLSAPAGFDGLLVQGSGPSNWGLRVFESAGSVGPKQELSNGAYPAGVTSGIFILRFRGPKLRF